jgi:hypothetical protein
MVRSYDVDFYVLDNRAGFMLYCFEEDDCVHEQFYRNSDDAHYVGHKFLDGCYVRGYILEDVA